MIIRVNQSHFRLSVLSDILCALCGPKKQPEHKEHAENIAQSSQSGYIEQL